MSDLEARDLIESDMASHERKRGEVHADRNQALAADALRQLDRERSESKAAPVLEPVVPPPEPVKQTKVVDGREYTLGVDGNVCGFRNPTEFEHSVLAHAQPRIDLLMTKRDEGPLGQPSWRTRTLAAMYFKVKAIEAIKGGLPDEAKIYERAFQQDLYELLEASNASFGDWRKDSPGKLIVGA